MKLAVRAERWPIAGTFTIARGAKTEAEVVVVEIADGPNVGRGECVPYARYGETTASVIAAIESERVLDRASLTVRGAARSAIDCALWDLEAKRTGRSVAELAGLDVPAPFVTATTISIDTPERMASAARALDRPLLKLKLAGDGVDLDRVRAVRDAAPRATLWVDANEGWDTATYDALAPRLAALDVALLEQPLPAAQDHALRGRARPIPICADESAHDASTIASLADRYDAVNVKLDKAGGLTGAIATIDAARAAGLRVALGCMVCTSLAIAPACLLVSRADWIDLDGSILLARDRDGGARFEAGTLVPPSSALWG
ncbi:N-acetyl-D-Glu racemase DgcA [Sandaracinus amylolyticus]|uniref:N-acetyl-D-Glu racemase DgcA n=1 Tax=Sandaracinus amylolyticus TaxID=927083 RepID=UPI001F25B640|nr:N-acetyl-D-Glu racemase DgcA [Sandaracinus amylolyticus]UJR79083.1 Dipeptide epimerase [Sandaracinus amylolyticus]